MFAGSTSVPMAQKPACGIAVAGFFMDWYFPFGLHMARDIEDCIKLVWANAIHNAMRSNYAI
jgi:hypothetical protein